MRTKQFLITFITVCLFVFTSCSNTSDTPPEETCLTQSLNLIEPRESCEGTLENNRLRVRFRWTFTGGSGTSASAIDKELIVRQGGTIIERISIGNESSKDVLLDYNESYSWTLQATSCSQTISDRANFSTVGATITNGVASPALIEVVYNAQEDAMEASFVSYGNDQESLTYLVYVSQDEDPQGEPVFNDSAESGITQSVLLDSSILSNSGETYYIKVETTNSTGSTSISTVSFEAP